MKIKHEINFILQIIFISLIKTNLVSNDSFRWDEESLFDYIKLKFLTVDNKTNNLSEFHYMIIDSNEYIKNNDLILLKNNLEKLYKEYNITCFLYILNNVKKNTELNYNLKYFNDKLFSEIHKYISFDECSTLSLLFQVGDDKMNIRLGSYCRNIISDSEAFQILKDNGNYLTNKQVNILLKKFFSSFINKYSHNYHQYIKGNKNIFSYLRQLLTFKGILISSIIIISYFFLIYFCLIYKISDKCNENNNSNTYIENNIEKFIKENKEESLEKIMKTFCIICLNNYDYDNLIATNTDNKDKINLPCGHIYHQVCLYKYFKIQNNKICPFCKAKFKIKLDDTNEKINIKNFTLNNSWDNNDDNSFGCFIKEFIDLQKKMNSFDIKNEFCDKMINLYNNKQNLENSTVKIKNY